MGDKCGILVENVTKTFGSQEVLKAVSAKFEPGKIYGIVGRNGSGKTVLLKCICGLLYPQAGTVTVDGKVVGKEVDYKKHVGNYSLGMRQRLGIAQALMENPDILILDEPMNALDHNGVEEMRAVLLQMKEQGKLVLIASHFRDDIDILCDEVYGMDAGIMEQVKTFSVW